MSQTIANLSNILKEYYLGPVVEQLNNEVLLLSRLESRSEDLVGKRAYVPLHTGRTSGIGARGELQTLPTAGKQGYDKAVYDLKYLYGRVQVSGPSMAKTKNEAGAFLQLLRASWTAFVTTLRRIWLVRSTVRARARLLAWPRLLPRLAVVRLLRWTLARLFARVSCTRAWSLTF